ncbi:mitochondrial carrier [Sodiomyces alkalinus F11]|uniref:Mitochondrial carrier n=1 Tax=Sodiomyces alkalinus (strain CBS 110278 / VKM F-3762 / F11) TaxID=1314773 RepID=A0A3N2PTQ8_SODAK|nr:mitochondrial carrier [Sodiomyces alkalinus F11]ROT37878.1 mitochondrial carrier [Sodiomyces alkalinus F11]
MSADFWAGYVSGAVGILIGNPLDLIKVRLQARDTALAGQTPAAYARQFGSAASLVTGTAAPIFGYGALNALLFVSYNRTEAALHSAFSAGGGAAAHSSSSHPSLWSTWIAGAVGGLATWVVSTPTELVKCRAQVSSPRQSSWSIAKQVYRGEGVRGLYFGGVVTALRDSIGYGFYFWSYELASRWIEARSGPLAGGDDGDGHGAGVPFRQEAAKVLLCGGLAGIVTWASVFPLDVVKTRVQTQVFEGGSGTPASSSSPLLSRGGGGNAGLSSGGGRLGAVEMARAAYREGGMSVFFRGLTVCSVRAFIVNAVQWAVYEWIMAEMGHGRKRKASIESG